ncbi:MAG: heme biosynthesis protein HemY [Rhodobacterales bacterium]|nr:MAG: heme biosynthesis protein HemY [Rhodobacterales bacterium]
MILSLLKILLFVAAVGAMAWGASWLMTVDGSAVINVAGTEITLSVLQMVVAALIVIFAVWLGIKLLGFLVALFRFLNGDETAISRYFGRTREQRGFKALTEGLMALAAGEGKEALAKAKQANKLLEKPELTNLLTAQAAEMAGDRKTAEETYKALLTNDKTRFVGIRGIMKQKLAEGDTDTAMKLAEKAFAIKPGHAETQDTLLKLQADSGDWDGARKTLGAKLKAGHIPRDLHRRRDAVLALSEAKGLTDEGNDIKVREAAIEANRLSPDLIPAAVMAARSYIANGNKKYATRVLTKAWEARPHPDLAAAFAEVEPEETAEARVKRFQTLTRHAPDHAETKMLLAELNIAAEDFPQARRALGDLVETDPTARSLTLMAAIERGEGANDAVVRGWLTKALSAPRGPQWICENCQTVHPEWAPVCDNCGSFDTLAWKRAKANEIAMPHSTEMLPLVTGPAEDTGVVVVDPDAPVIEDKLENVPDAEESEARPAT